MSAPLELQIVLKAPGDKLASDFQAARQQALKEGQAVGDAFAAGTGKAAAAYQQQAERMKTLALGNVVAQDAQKAEASFRSLEQAAGRLDPVFAELSGGTIQLGRVLEALSSPLALVTGGVLGMIIGMKLLTDHMVETFQHIRQLQAVSGGTVEQVHALSGAFALVGLSSDVMATAMFRMANQVESGGAGLAKLGITLKDLQRIGDNEIDLFLEVHDRITALGSAGERSAALMEVFGRAGRQLAPIFAMSRDELQSFMQRAHELSGWTEESQARTAKYIEAQAELNLIWQRGADILGTRMIPALTALAHGLAEALKTKITREQEMAETALEVMNPGGSASKALADAWTQWAKSVETAETQSMQIRRLATEQRVATTQTELATVLAAIATEDAARKIALATRTIGERTVVEQELSGFDRRMAEVTKMYAAELAHAKLNDDQTGKLVQGVQAKYETQFAAINAGKADSIAKLITLDQKYFDNSVKLNADLLKNLTTGWENFAKDYEKILRQTITAQIELSGTEEDLFLNRLENERHEAERTWKQMGMDYEELNTLLSQLDAKQDAQKQGFYRKEESAFAKSLKQQYRTLVRSAETETEKVQREYNERKNSLDVLLANQYIGDQDYNERVARLRADLSVNLLRADLDDQAKHAHRLAGDRATEGDFFGFMSAQFQLMQARAGTTWNAIGQFVSDVTQGMRGTLSDGFFQFFTTGTVRMSDFFKNMLNSMARALSDFLASQVVRGFFSVLFGGGGGGFLSGLLGGLLGGGSGGGGNGNGGAADGAGGGLLGGLLNAVGLGNFANNLSGGSLFGSLGSGITGLLNRITGGGFGDLLNTLRGTSIPTPGGQIPTPDLPSGDFNMPPISVGDIPGPVAPGGLEGGATAPDVTGGDFGSLTNLTGLGETASGTSGGGDLSIGSFANLASLAGLGFNMAGSESGAKFAGAASQALGALSLEAAGVTGAGFAAPAAVSSFSGAAGALAPSVGLFSLFAKGLGSMVSSWFGGSLSQAEPGRSVDRRNLMAAMTMAGEQIGGARTVGELQEAVNRLTLVGLTNTGSLTSPHFQFPDDNDPSMMARANQMVQSQLALIATVHMNPTAALADPQIAAAWQRVQETHARADLVNNAGWQRYIDRSNSGQPLYGVQGGQGVPEGEVRTYTYSDPNDMALKGMYYRQYYGPTAAMLSGQPYPGYNPAFFDLLHPEQAAAFHAEQLAANLIANAPTEGAGFQHGGIVPGPIGAPMVALVHGGEEIRTPAQRGGFTINIVINGQTNGRELVDQIERELALRRKRAPWN